MWLALTQHGTNDAIWVNTDLVDCFLEPSPTGDGAGCKLFFSGGKEVMVKEAFDRTVERMQIA
jgi:hypothetical protein